MKDEDGKKYSEEHGCESVWEALGIAGDNEDSVDVLEATGMTQRQQEHLWDEIRQLRYIDIPTDWNPARISGRNGGQPGARRSWLL